LRESRDGHFLLATVEMESVERGIRGVGMERLPGARGIGCQHGIKNPAVKGDGLRADCLE